MVKLLFFVFSFFLFAFQLNGQFNVDSLLQVAQSDRSDSIRFDAYHELSYYYNSRDTALAYFYVDKLKVIAQQSEIKNADIKIYNRLGNLAQMGGNFDKSIEYFKLGISSISDSANIARFYGGIGSCFYYINNLDSAEYYLYKSYDIKTRWDADDPSSLARSLNNLALLAEQQINYISAIQYYQEALDIALTQNDERQTAVIYNNMGAGYSDMGETEIALNYFKKSYDLAKRIDDTRTIGNSATNLGSYYSENNKSELGIKYLDEAILSFKKVGHKFDLANTYQILGDNYIGLNQPEKALPILLSGFALADSIDSKGTMIRIGINLSEIKFSNGDFNAAKEFIDKSLVYFNDFDDFEDRLSCYKQAYIVYEKLNLDKEALVFHEIYTKTKDSLDEGRQNKLVKELQFKYQTAEKEIQLKAQSIEIEKKTQERNFYFFGVCLIGLMAIFLINRKNLKQKLTEEKLYSLQQKNKLIAVDNMIQGQEDERRRIAKDLHDGLGGLLSSARLMILKVQDEIDKIENFQLIKKAETLIDTASDELRRIAHDMMPDALINLGLKSAILDLSQEINESSNINVETYFSSEEFNLDEKIQVIVYRIIQELSHNAIKYSQANKLLIQLMDTGANYELTVEDDGVGFNFSEALAKNGMGLQNLVSRLDYLDASYQFDNKNGASYLITIPKTLS